MGDNTYKGFSNSSNEGDNAWTLVSSRRKKPIVHQPDNRPENHQVARQENHQDGNSQVARQDNRQYGNSQYGNSQDVRQENNQDDQDDNSHSFHAYQNHAANQPRNFERSDKISEPCWFYNNGGCRHKDGTEKTAEECKYLHLYSENVKRPPHLSTRKPCDKYNLEGECKWHDNCKYSHRNLTPEEWSRFYPGIPYTLKTNVQKRLQIENKISDLEGKMRVIEFKQDGISKDVQQIGQTLQQLLRRTLQETKQ